MSALPPIPDDVWEVPSEPRVLRAEGGLCAPIHTMFPTFSTMREGFYDTNPQPPPPRKRWWQKRVPTLVQMGMRRVPRTPYIDDDWWD